MDEFLLALRVLLTLAALLALLWWVQRRIARRPSAKPDAPAISVVSRQALTPKAQAVLIEADGKRLLLGVTEQAVTVLHADAVAMPSVEARQNEEPRRARLALAPEASASAPGGLSTQPALADVASFEAALARAQRQSAADGPQTNTVAPDAATEAPLRRPRNNRRRITPETVGWRAYGGELLKVARGR